jgi:hypothetical protein
MCCAHVHCRCMVSGAAEMQAGWLRMAMARTGASVLQATGHAALGCPGNWACSIGPDCRKEGRGVA